MFVRADIIKVRGPKSTQNPSGIYYITSQKGIRIYKKNGTYVISLEKGLKKNDTFNHILSFEINQKEAFGIRQGYVAPLISYIEYKIKNSKVQIDPQVAKSLDAAEFIKLSQQEYDIVQSYHYDVLKPSKKYNKDLDYLTSDRTKYRYHVKSTYDFWYYTDPTILRKGFYEMRKEDIIVNLLLKRVEQASIILLDLTTRDPLLSNSDLSLILKSQKFKDNQYTIQQFPIGKVEYLDNLTELEKNRYETIGLTLKFNALPYAVGYAESLGDFVKAYSTMLWRARQMFLTRTWKVDKENPLATYMQWYDMIKNYQTAYSVLIGGLPIFEIIELAYAALSGVTLEERILKDYGILFYTSASDTIRGEPGNFPFLSDITERGFILKGGTK